MYLVTIFDLLLWLSGSANNIAAVISMTHQLELSIILFTWIIICQLHIVYDFIFMFLVFSFIWLIVVIWLDWILWIIIIVEDSSFFIYFLLSIAFICKIHQSWPFQPLLFIDYLLIQQSKSVTSAILIRLKIIEHNATISLLPWKCNNCTFHNLVIFLINFLFIFWQINFLLPFLKWLFWLII